MPPSFWMKAIKATCEIQNRLPHSSLLNGTSPHEAFFNEKPSRNHFYVFRSIAYIHILEERCPPQSAWNDKATKGVIVGYLSSSLYECYNLQRHKFCNQEHPLMIHENKFATLQDFDSRIAEALSVIKQTNSPSDPTPKPLYDMINVQNLPKTSTLLSNKPIMKSSHIMMQS